MTQQPKFDEVQFPLSTLTLAAKVWGPADGAPVIALHGWMDNANSFAPLAPLLPDIRLVALDLAGHGRSDHRPGRNPYYIWEYALDVVDVADALGWERFGLLGHSLGGGIATIVAGMVPERVDRLVLIENVGPVAADPEKVGEHLLKARRAEQGVVKTLQRQAENPGRARFANTDEAVERRTLVSPFQLTREATATLIERGTRAVPDGFAWSHDQRLTLPSAVRMTKAQLHFLIAQIAAPTDLILGNDGLFMDEKRKPLMDERLPLFQKLNQHILTGGHHLHMDEGAEPIAQIVNDAFG